LARETTLVTPTTPETAARRLDATDRRIIGLALPALGSLAAEPLYVLVDTAIVGRLGTPQLGGLALSATVMSLVAYACMFLAYGTTERVARRVGARQPVAAAETGVQAMWLGGVICVPVALAVGFGARPLAAALGGSGDVLEFATTYLRISAVGIPAVVFVLTAQGVQRGVSDYRRPMVILLASNALNAVLEVIFVFGLDLGVPGSAWSTVIAQVLAAAVFAVVLRRHLRPARRRRPRWSEMRPLVTAGRHLLLRSVSMLVVLVGATSVASRIDEPTLAAHQIAVSVLTLVALVLDALAIPAQTLVAEQLGAETVAGAGEINRRVVRLTLWCAGAIGVVIAAASPILPRAFTGDGAVISRATAALCVLGLAVIVPGGIAYATDGSLIGAGDYRFLGRAAAAYLAVLVPIGAAILAADLGIVAIWSAIAVWVVLRAVVNSRRAAVLFTAGRSAPYGASAAQALR
jgi:MATE family, multidrug efflux pump